MGSSVTQGARVRNETCSNQMKHDNNVYRHTEEAHFRRSITLSRHTDIVGCVSSNLFKPKGYIYGEETCKDPSGIKIPSTTLNRPSEHKVPYRKPFLFVKIYILFSSSLEWPLQNLDYDVGLEMSLFVGELVFADDFQRPPGRLSAG